MRMKMKTWVEWLELLVGILLLIGGIYTLIHPSASLAGISFLYGCLAIFTGILDIVFYVQMDRRTGFGPATALITGILGVLAGLCLTFQPAIGAWVLAWGFPIWFIVHCVSRLSRLNRIRFLTGNGHYYFSLVVNIIGLILGFFMLVNPFLALVSVPYIIGCYLILLGIDGIVVALITIGNKR